MKITKHRFLNSKHSSKSLAGFSLIEIAGVLTIIAIVTAALLSFANNKITDARIASTRQKMELIEKALQAFVKQYGYLPCPAKVDLVNPLSCNGDATCINNNKAYGWGVGSGGVNSGVAAGDCSASGATSLGSNVYSGMIPFKTLSPTLGSSLTVDSWGNRILYVVDQAYTSKATTSAPDGSTAFGYSNAYSANTGIIIATRASGGNIVEGTGSGLCSGSCQVGVCGNGYCSSSANNYLPESKKAAYVLVSYGSNGFYGRSDRSPTIINEASANANEIENNPVNVTFVQRLLDTTFDDIVRFKTRWQLE